MSHPETGDEWQTLCVKKPISDEINDFKNLYDLSTNQEAVKVLLSVTEATGIPVTGAEKQELPELTPESIEDLTGFIINDSTGASVVGTDTGDLSRLVSEPASTDSKIEPFARTNITDADVYCPVCNSIVLDYSLSPVIPTVDAGLFSGITIQCPTCDSTRRQYTLFAVESGVKPDDGVLQKAMQKYTGVLLIAEPSVFTEFTDRARACRDLAFDGGWNWLPDPRAWVHYESEVYGEISVKQYVDFLVSYFQFLTVDEGDVPEQKAEKVLDFTVYHPGEESSIESDTLESQWRIIVESSTTIPDVVFTEFSDLSSSWDEIGLEVSEFEPQGFAESAYVISIPGLASV